MSSPTHRWAKARRRADFDAFPGRAVHGEEVEGDGVARGHVERRDLELVAACVDVRQSHRGVSPSRS